ncbi:MAG: alanine racemase [Oscillospiraceae bacterium]|jgi:alanine racemase|nr:alanine racemase [Oscillospiraceae bacterium]
MPALDFPRRTWIEIDLDALAANYRTARALAAPCARVMAVLKANAYGHGAVRVARRLAAEGADFFAVSCVREALQLRAGGIEAAVLVLGALEEPLLGQALRAGLTLTVCGVQEARAVAQAAALRGEPVSVHIKIDAGFHRLGLPAEAPDTPAAVREICGLPYLFVEGLYAHLSLRDPADDAAQAARVQALCETLRGMRCAPPMLHLVDSIGLVRYPQWHFDAVRVGALLYGVRPARSEGAPFACLPTLRFMTTITRLHWAPEGACVGYDEDHPLRRPTLVATLPAGYGDGYPRAMGGRASVSIRGCLAPVLGWVCMDQMMADVTDVPGVAAGDPVALLGEGVSLADYAAWARTNRNGALATLSQRPQRVYFAGGEAVAVDDALLGGGGHCPHLSAATD